MFVTLVSFTIANSLPTVIQALTTIAPLFISAGMRLLISYKDCLALLMRSVQSSLRVTTPSERLNLQMDAWYTRYENLTRRIVMACPINGWRRKCRCNTQCLDGMCSYGQMSCKYDEGLCKRCVRAVQESPMVMNFNVKCLEQNVEDSNTEKDSEMDTSEGDDNYISDEDSDHKP